MEEQRALLLASVNYLVMEKCHGTALERLEREKAHGDDMHTTLLRAYCLSKLDPPHSAAGRASDALRLLNPLQKSGSTHAIAILFAMQIAYNSETSIDKASVEQVESRIQQLWAAEIPEPAAYSSALLLMLEGALDKAKILADRLSAPDSATAAANVSALKGWIHMLRGKGDIKHALELFDAAIADARAPEGFLGKAKVLEQRRNAAGIKTVLEEGVAAHPIFTPFYVELMKASMMLRDWNEVLEIGQKAIVMQNEFVPTQLLYELVYAALVQGNSQSVEQILAELADITAKTESRNAELNYQLSSFLLSIATNDHPQIIEQGRRLLERAIAIRGSRGEYLVLRGRIAMLEGSQKQALQMFSKAVENELPDDPLPTFYSCECYIRLGKLQEAQSQLDFLRTTHKGAEHFSRYHYLAAQLLASANTDEATFLYRQCVDLHLDYVQSLPFGLEFVRRLNIPYITDIASVLLRPFPLIPSFQHEPRVKEAERVLQLLIDYCPGSFNAAYLLAKVKFLSNDLDSSETLLRASVDRSSHGAETYLLLARILVQKHDLEEAAKILDAGLAFNFSLREHPFYFLMRARIEKKEAKVEQSIASLQSAMQLSEFKAAEMSTSAVKDLGTNEADVVSIYLELIDSLQMLNRIQEADAVMETAERLFADKAAGERLTILNAKLQLQRRNVENALNTLQSIKPQHSSYQEAQILLAQIYLKEEGDKQKFAQCYRLIVEKNPTAHAFELCGDAMMSIQEPTAAIDAYETAMRRNPRDHRLAEKIGDAYVKTHLYNRAITFYEAAMKQSGKQNVLRIRFAEQLYKMGNYEKCMKVLKVILEKEKEPTGAQGMRDHVSHWMLLSKLHLNSGERSSALKDLTNAHKLQHKLIKEAKNPEMRGQGMNLVDEQKLAATISSRLAEVYCERRDFIRAIELYKEAIAHDDKNLKSQLSLAKTYMAAGRLEDCSQVCYAVLSSAHDVQSKTEANMLLADIMYQKNESEQRYGDEALKHFSRILEANPNHYHALSHFVELSWRQGSFDLAERALKNAVENNARLMNDPGYNYCKGLIEWYGGEPNTALQSFNRAKKDVLWGEKAISNMIEICLNPDNEILGSDNMEVPSQELDPTELDFRIKTAERFLKELEAISGFGQAYQRAENLILVSSPNKADVQRALNNFLALDTGKAEGPSVAESTLNIAAIYGSARAYLTLKQTPKAKAQLKRIIHYPWSLADADNLHQSWLLLADIYMKQGKGEQAMGILRTVLSHNASTAKAFECMGILCERDQRYIDAAANYEAAWRLGKNRNPAIGYKLAYNYFKCRKLFECIDVCHRVLQQYPSYPKIKTEILDKARANLRI